MKNRESYKHKNYGPIPQNDYNTTNTEKSSIPENVLEYDPQADDTAEDAIDEQLSLKQRVRHRPNKMRSGDRMHSGKENGWRTKSASQHDDDIDVRRCSNNVKKNKLNFD